jgi:hypothetical protein
LNICADFVFGWLHYDEILKKFGKLLFSGNLELKDRSAACGAFSETWNFCISGFEPTAKWKIG